MGNVLRVLEVMMTNFKKSEGTRKVTDVLPEMKKDNVNAVLVEPRDESDVFGILTLKDIARKVIGKGRRLHETHAYEIMSKPVLSIPGDMPLPYAARLMTNFNVSYGMVINQDQVVGLVSLNGIVHHWKEDA